MLNFLMNGLTWMEERGRTKNSKQEKQVRQTCRLRSAKLSGKQQRDWLWQNETHRQSTRTTHNSTRKDAELCKHSTGEFAEYRSWQLATLFFQLFFFFLKRKTSFSYPFSFSLNQPNESIKLIIKSKGELDILHDSVGYIQLQTEQKPSQKIMQRPCRKGKSIGKDERSKFSGFGFCNLPFFQSGHTMFHICGTIFFWHYLDTSSLPLPLSY